MCRMKLCYIEWEDPALIGIAHIAIAMCASMKWIIAQTTHANALVENVSSEASAVEVEEEEEDEN